MQCSVVFYDSAAEGVVAVVETLAPSTATPTATPTGTDIVMSCSCTYIHGVIVSTAGCFSDYFQHQ
jgi:hypothetical protein